LKTFFEPIRYFTSALVLLALPALMLPLDLSARTLEMIQKRGVLSLCAPPNSLPFAKKAQPPHGLLIDIGAALAQQLQVRLEVEWVVANYHIPRVGCDIVLNSINDRVAQQERRVTLSRPYQRSGVVLVVQTNNNDIKGFDDLSSATRVGVMLSSMVSVMLGERGVTTTPFGFEEDILDELSSGRIDAAAVSPDSAGYYIHHHKDAELKIIYAYETEPQLSWTLAAGMRGADQSLVQAIDAALEQLLAEGSLTAIYARYGIEHKAP
jgi:polar amino acid transport system substrate-binding protein